MAENGKKVEREVERLTQPDWLKDVESGEGERHSSVRAEISNAMVGLKKNFYGKGPTKAKTFLNDNYIFCVMEGGLTRNEETMVERGHEDLVRTFRLRFQEAMTEPMVEAVQARHRPQRDRLSQPDRLPPRASLRDLRARPPDRRFG